MCREANVRGFITLGTPFGGAVNAVAYRVGGYPYLLPSAIEELLGDRIRNISYAAGARERRAREKGVPGPARACDAWRLLWRLVHRIAA